MKTYVLPVSDRFNFTYFGDVHIHNTTPRATPDLNAQSYLDLLNQILETSGEVIICGGDLFHSPEYSKEYSNKYVTLLSKHLNWKRLIWCLGNHDIYAYSSTNLKETIPGLLQDSLQTLKDSHYALIGIDERKIEVRFNSGRVLDIFLFDARTKLKEYVEFITGLKENVNPFITVGHQKVGPTISDYCISYSDLPYHKNQLLAFWADIHEPFLERVNNTLVVNNGSVARRSIGETYPSHVYDISVIEEGKELKCHLVKTELDYDRGREIKFDKAKKGHSAKEIKDSSENLFKKEESFKDIKYLKSLFPDKNYESLLLEIINELNQIDD